MFKKWCLERVSENIKLEMGVSKENHSRGTGMGNKPITLCATVTSPSIFMDTQ